MRLDSVVARELTAVEKVPPFEGALDVPRLLGLARLGCPCGRGVELRPRVGVLGHGLARLDSPGHSERILDRWEARVVEPCEDVLDVDRVDDRGLSRCVARDVELEVEGADRSVLKELPGLDEANEGADLAGELGVDSLDPSVVRLGA